MRQFQRVTRFMFGSKGSGGLNISEIIDIENPLGNQSKRGRLLLCPTPLGNVHDITLRQYKALAQSDVIACEDSRVTNSLLQLFDKKGLQKEFSEIFDVTFPSDKEPATESEKQEESSDKQSQQQQLNSEASTEVTEVDSEVTSYLEVLGVNDENKLQSREERLKEKVVDLRKKLRALLLEQDQLNIYDEKKKREQILQAQPLESRGNEDDDGGGAASAESSFFGIEDDFINYLRAKIVQTRKFKKRGVLIGLHKFNEEYRSERIIKILSYGINVTLVSDAGVPCISDPGFQLVRRCYEEGLAVEGLPGGSACTLAVSQSGFPADNFYFGGFLSKTQSKREAVLEDSRDRQCTAVFYENLQRLAKTLLSIEKIYGQRQFVWLGNELTKYYEKKERGTVHALYELVDQNEKSKNFWKGEIVIVIAPFSQEFNSEIVENMQPGTAGEKVKKHYFKEWENTKILQDEAAEKGLPIPENPQHIMRVHAREAANILSERLDVSDKDLAELLTELLKISRNRAMQLVIAVRHLENRVTIKEWNLLMKGQTK